MRFFTAATRSADFVDVDGGGGAEASRDFQRSGTAGDGDDAHAAARKHADEFQSDGAAADDRGGVAGAHFHFVNAAQHTGQRLDERRAAVIDGVRNLEHIFHGDASGNAQIFGVRAIVEEQIFAEIFLAAAAMVAAQAGRGIGGDHAHADAPASVDALADGGDFADHFVTEDRGRLNHLRVIAALPDFEVGAVSKSETHAEQDFIGGERGHVDFLDAQIFAAVQNGGVHLRPEKPRSMPRRLFARAISDLLCGGRSHS